MRKRALTSWSFHGGCMEDNSTLPLGPRNPAASSLGTGAMRDRRLRRSVQAYHLCDCSPQPSKSSVGLMRPPPHSRLPNLYLHCPWCKALLQCTETKPRRNSPTAVTILPRTFAVSWEWTVVNKGRRRNRERRLTIRMAGRKQSPRHTPHRVWPPCSTSRGRTSPTGPR